MLQKTEEDGSRPGLGDEAPVTEDKKTDISRMTGFIDRGVRQAASSRHTQARLRLCREQRSLSQQKTEHQRKENNRVDPLADGAGRGGRRASPHDSHRLTRASDDLIRSRSLCKN
ncbi:hypothetical protein J6590_026790 [Homalodisca vitripennis]|nr:hypothetical protein J6590_026790 [Homalodisca vitripennis]